MQKTKGRLDLGVVLERRDVENPWIDHSWTPVGVIPGAAPLDPRGPWMLLKEGPGWARFHAGTLPLELYRRETEGYKVNLAQQPPRIFVVLRDDDDPESEHELLPFLVTVCPYEAQDYMDSGEEVVEPVTMPEAVAAFVQDYCGQHHVEETFTKRQRKRHFEEAGRGPGLRTSNGRDPADG